MLKLPDADVYVTQVNTNHGAWATCGVSLCVGRSKGRAMLGYAHRDAPLTNGNMSILPIYSAL